MTIRINASELHQRVGDILAQIRYTGERVIIERRGKAIAVVVSMEDLERLQNAPATSAPKSSASQQIANLERSAALHALILKRRRGKKLNSSQLMREMREERMRHVTGLR